VFYFAAVAAEATFRLEFPYRRSVGPVIGAFLTALRDGKVVGIRTGAGRVMVPPLEYDPDTGDGLGVDALVDVADTGVVTTAAWVAEPMPKHPLDRPFAWALITLDGADTALLHAVDGNVERGARVKARWRTERTGHISDIECFEIES
jgi:uncharacterized OB-fold protein